MIGFENRLKRLSSPSQARVRRGSPLCPRHDCRNGISLWPLENFTQWLSAMFVCKSLNFYLFIYLFVVVFYAIIGVMICWQFSFNFAVVSDLALHHCFSAVQIREEKRGKEGSKNGSAATEVWYSERSWAWEDEKWEGEVRRFFLCLKFTVIKTETQCLVVSHLIVFCLPSWLFTY